MNPHVVTLQYLSLTTACERSGLQLAVCRMILKVMWVNQQGGQGFHTFQRFPAIGMDNRVHWIFQNGWEK
jgi:hypothetical protein